MDFKEIVKQLEEYKKTTICSDQKHMRVDMIIEDMQKIEEMTNDVAFCEWYDKYYIGLLKWRYHREELKKEYLNWCNLNKLNPIGI